VGIVGAQNGFFHPQILHFVKKNLDKRHCTPLWATLVFFFWSSAVLHTEKGELRWIGQRFTKKTCRQKLSCISWVIAQISCLQFAWQQNYIPQTVSKTLSLDLRTLVLGIGILPTVQYQNSWTPKLIMSCVIRLVQKMRHSAGFTSVEPWALWIY